MFDFIAVLSFFWLIILLFLTNKSLYNHYTTTQATLCSLLFPVLFSFAYKLYALADSTLTTHTSPFNDLREIELLVPSIREGFYLPLDTNAFGFNAFLVSGVITSFIFTALSGSKPQAITLSAFYALGVILSAGFLLISTDSLVLLFLSFELLLLSSLFLLRLTSKSERVIEASTEMFFWTLVGSLALLVAFTWMFSMGVTSISTTITEVGMPPVIYPLLVVGFGVKIPVWPFFSWLLKAHVEASVEFSILLSGFIVKAGVWALYRLIQHTCSIFGTMALIALCTIGVLIATLRLCAQRDLKRIVALTTVIEMNWLGFCLALGNATYDKVAMYLVAVHSVITSLEFMVVESVSKRFNSRDLTQISGLTYYCPLLAVVAFYTTLVTIGFPGTPLFFAKLVFFSVFVTTQPILFFVYFLVLLLLLPLIFMRIWVPVWFGSSGHSTSPKFIDLSQTENLIYSTLIILTLIFSFCPGLLIQF